MTLVPAYGRDYKSAKAVKEDWVAGRDFQISDISSQNNGSYTSKRDSDCFASVTIRYSKLTKAVIV